MKVRVVQPDPYMVIELDSTVEMHISPYTADRLHIRLSRLVFDERTKQNERSVFAYFDIGLDDLLEIHSRGSEMIGMKLGALA